MNTLRDKILYKFFLYLLVLYQCYDHSRSFILIWFCWTKSCLHVIHICYLTFWWQAGTAFVKENKWCLYFLETVSEVCVSRVFQWELLHLSSEPQRWNFDFSSCNLIRKSMAVYDGLSLHCHWIFLGL
jgi:hypothetical protein